MARTGRNSTELQQTRQASNEPLNDVSTIFTKDTSAFEQAHEALTALLPKITF
jgi:hypothetical protein